MTTLSPPAPLHEVSKGITPTASWHGKLNVTLAQGSYPLSKMLGVLAGQQNAGKTHLASSHPNGLILNLDCSGSVHPSRTTPQWPNVDPVSGNVLDAQAPMNLRWHDVLRMRDKLVAMAKAGEPRPDTVFVDTLPKALALIKDWMYDESKLVEGGVRKTFDDYQGQNKWDAVTTTLFSQLIYPLRHAGYGVWLMVHLTADFKGASDNPDRPKRQQPWRMNLTPSLLSRLSHEVEMFMYCIRLEDYVDRTELVNGKSTPVRTTVFRNLVKFMDSRLTTNRVRVPLPTKLSGELDITDAPDGWPRAEAWYQTARI